MKEEDRQFLNALLAAPGPSGAEQPVQRLLADYLRDHADVFETDFHGNLIARRAPDAAFRVMLSAHADQVGFMVRYIDADGFAFLEFVGGGDKKVMPGANVKILGPRGPIFGIIGKKATHLESSKEQNNAPIRSEIWIDIGATSKEDAEKHIAVGNYAVFMPNVTNLANGRIAAPALDDRAGLFAAARAFCACKLKSGVGLDLASTVQEELGGRGATTAAARLKPTIAIAVDLTNASDDPAGDPKTQIECTMGGGPSISSGPNTNPVLREILVNCAKEKSIPYQLSPTGELESNDAKELQISDGGIATITVALPNRNMHTQAEICALEDIENTVRLLIAFLDQVGRDLDLRPIAI